MCWKLECLNGNFKGICYFWYEDKSQDLIGRTTDFERPIKCLIPPAFLHQYIGPVEKAAGIWNMELLHVHIHG